MDREWKGYKESGTTKSNKLASDAESSIITKLDATNIFCRKKGRKRINE